MSSVLSLAELQRAEPVQLPDGVTVLSVAEASRGAALGFVDGSAAPWGKSGLAAWLAGPYRLVVRHAPRFEDRTDRPSDVVPLSVRSQLNSDDIDAILQSARQEVMTTLRVAAPPQTNMSFAHTAVYAGRVARSRDMTGRAGWVPVDGARMRLADRVLSLVAVDYLMRPADYMALLTVCKSCEAISFDAQARSRGRCRSHATSLRRIPISK